VELVDEAEEQVTGEHLLTEMLSLLERFCYPHFDRDSGVQEPLTTEQLDNFSDAMLLMIAKNKIRKVANDGTSLREA
jgi:hypothetical protein